MNQHNPAATPIARSIGTAIARGAVLTLLLLPILGFFMRALLPVTDPYPPGPTDETAFECLAGITCWGTALSLSVLDALLFLRTPRRWKVAFWTMLTLAALWTTLVLWDSAILDKWHRIQNQQIEQLESCK